MCIRDRNKVLRFLAIFSPVIYILLSGNLSYFLVYGVRSSRYAMDSSIGRMMSMLILLSIYAYFFEIFSTPPKKGKVLFSCLYIFLITWLQGKRFILVLIGVVFLFFYTRKGLTLRQQRNLRKVLPLVAIGIITVSYTHLHRGL